MNFYGRDFLKLLDYTEEEIIYLIKLAMEFKKKKQNGKRHDYLRGKNVVLLFEKDSTRTRCAFEVGAMDLGMGVTYLGPTGSQMGKKESIADTARVLARMYDGIEYRGFSQQIVEDLAKYADVPVWNGLTTDFHPTQMLADFMTLKEHFGYIKGLHLSHYGDIRNNGTITAASINIAVNNGDYVQTDMSNRINNIGGNPEDIYSNPNNRGTGIFANGNVVITARYVNINSTIQSGDGNHNVAIPADYKLYYLDNDVKTEVSMNDISGWSDSNKRNRVIYVSDNAGNKLDYITYDATNCRFVVEELVSRGGKVEITGTILNTDSNNNSGSLNKDYQLPPLSILNKPKNKARDTDNSIIEKNTEPIEKRFETFEISKTLNIPVVLYMKPILENITVKDLDLYKSYIEHYNIKDVVVGSIFTSNITNETVHFSNKNELFYNSIKDEDIIISELSKICSVYRRSTEVTNCYKMKQI